MRSVIEQFEKATVRYPLLAAAATLMMITSATTFPLLAACGGAFAVGLFVSMGVHIGLYLKDIGDQAKTTFAELSETIESVKHQIKKLDSEKTINQVNLTLTDLRVAVKSLDATLNVFKNTAKTLDDNLAFDKTKGETPLANQMKKTLMGLDHTISKVNAQLEEAPEGEEPTLLQTTKKAIQNVNGAAQEANGTLEQGRQGWVGWALGMSKAKAVPKAIKITKEKAKAASTEEPVPSVEELLSGLEMLSEEEAPKQKRKSSRRR